MVRHPKAFIRTPMVERGVGAILVAGLCLCVGCAPGKVTLEGLEDFGRLGTALWLRLDGGEGDHVEVLLLSTASKQCAGVEEDLTAYDELRNGAWEEDYYQQQAERLEPYMGDGERLIYLTVYEADDDGHILPGDYAITDEEGSFGLVLHHYLENPFVAAAAAAAADEDLYAAMDAASDDWYLASGQLDLEERDTDTFDATVSGTLEDYDGQTAGTLEASFRAPYCEVPVGPEIIFGLLLFWSV